MVRLIVLTVDCDMNVTLGAVLVATLICLGMAGHFQSVLAASDLSAFHY
jgi:hypothetical protein